MATSSLQAPLFLSLLLIYITCISVVQANVDHTSFQLTTEALEWPSTTSLSDDFNIDEAIDRGGMMDRRSLYWSARHYYISYGALFANRIPCPARSGRSYYTHNCYGAGGPVHPYNRGCSAITHCRR